MAPLKSVIKYLGINVYQWIMTSLKLLQWSSNIAVYLNWHWKYMSFCTIIIRICGRFLMIIKMARQVKIDKIESFFYVYLIFSGNKFLTLLFSNFTVFWEWASIKHKDCLVRERNLENDKVFFIKFGFRSFTVLKTS